MEEMTSVMRCPFRVKAFDNPDTCDPACAWLVEEIATGAQACAVAVIAMYMGPLISTKINTFIAKEREEQDGSQ